MSDSTTSTETPAAGAAPGVAQSTPPRERRRVLLSSFVGALIEWYDFYLYGIAAAVVFNVVFFPGFDPLVGSLLAFTTLAIGFFARPLGGAIWGHFGDKIGRKKMLVLSIVAMGIGTTLMGLLPSYAQIGVWAPILLVLLRLIQGVAGGGEWGGAVLMAMEHAPKRRGFSSSFPQMGLASGILAANGVFALTALMPHAQLISWGWRLPFLFSAVLAVIGILIRVGMKESPVFIADQERKAKEEAVVASKRERPLIAVFRHPKTLITTVLLVIGPFGASAVYLTFAATYGLQVGFTTSQILVASLIGAGVGVVGQPLCAIWSDFIGRKKVVTLGLVVQVIGAFMLFPLMNSHSVPGFYLGIVVIAIGHALSYSPLGAWLGELYPTHLRYTGTSMGYQIAGSIGGGLTPAICALLLIAAGGAPNSALIPVYVVFLSLLSFIGVRMAKETYRSEL